MPASEKQQPVSVKKASLNELPNQSINTITNLRGSSPPPKDQGPSLDSPKVLGVKRQHDSPPSAPRSQATGNNTTNGHLVYVRRKLEHEQSKTSTSPESKKIGRGEVREKIVQKDQTNESSVPPPDCVGKTMTGLAEPEQKKLACSTETSINAVWKERYSKLQMFLKNCDQSMQEDYIRMLRSLSAVGRSKHAVELEKRAMHLFLEEGKELQRMQVLNVLGKATAKDHSSVST